MPLSMNKLRTSHSLAIWLSKNEFGKKREIIEEV